MIPLSPGQRHVLFVILRAIRQTGYVPSVRDICAARGFSSSSTAHQHLAALRRKNYLRRSLAYADHVMVTDPMDSDHPIVGKLMPRGAWKG